MNPHEADVAFRSRFGGAATVVVRAPGRVNLIGDHTDYSGGLVLPIAIDKAILVAAAPSGESRIRCHASLYDDTFDVSLDLDSCEGMRQWRRYVAGVAIVLRSQGLALGGADMWIGGDLPVGAGLASSAALEVGVALALLSVNGDDLPRETLARICLCAKAGHAMRLDCTTLAHRAVPLNPSDVVFVVIDSGVRHSIAAGSYAGRRQECERALDAIAGHRPGAASLADLRIADLPDCATWLEEVLFRRVRHVVTENERVRAAAEALEAGDAAWVGALMLESHASLRDDFEVSCAELDEIVERARCVPGVCGARMTGGGFGGCAIALVQGQAVGELMARCTRQRSGSGATAFVVRCVEGAQVITRG
jgi:galactokinase